MFQNRIFTTRCCSWLLVTLGGLVQPCLAEVTLSCRIDSAADRQDPLYNFWSIRNEIPPYPRVGRQQKPQANSMNCIRWLGGWAKDGKMQPEEDSCYWDENRQEYSYRLDKLIQRIDGVHRQGYRIHQLVLDNPPWCFQRGLKFGNNKAAGEYPEKDRISTYGNSLPPGDSKAWHQFIQAVMRMLVKNYGIKQVQQWRFRIGTESDYHPHHWAGTKMDFFNHYQNTADAVLSVLPDAKLAAHFLEAGGNGRYGVEFVTWCKQNKVKFDFIGISKYPTYNIPRHMDLERAYQKSFLPFVSARGWPSHARLEIPEHSLFTEPAPNIGIGVSTSHVSAFNVMFAKWVYEHSIGQVHSWGDKTDAISYQAIGTMLGKNRFDSQRTGQPKVATNKIDAIFAATEDQDRIDVLVYNFSPDPDYVDEETVNLSLTVPSRPGTRYAYRLLNCGQRNNAQWQFVQRHPEAGKRINEGGWITNRVKPDSKNPTDKNGDFKRILEGPGKSLWKKERDAMEQASLPRWSQTAFTNTDRGSRRNTSTLKLTLKLSSFSFQKVEFQKVRSSARR